MHTAKTIGYYAIWSFYYLLSFIVCSLVNLPWSTSVALNGIILSLIGLTIASPFLIAPMLINKLYRGNKRELHLKVWTDAIGALTVILIIGNLANIYFKGFSISEITLAPYYAYNICVTVTLFKLQTRSKKSKLING